MTSSLKKLFCLLLAAAMILSALTACGKKDAAEKTEEKEAISEEVAEEEPDYFPRPETETLSMWVPWSANTVESISDVRAVQEMEKRTNVHMDWLTVGQNEAQEQFGLLLASQDLPDIVANNYYPSGIPGALQDGVFMDVTDLVPKYMPRYMEILNSNPEYDKMTKLDDGRRGAIFQANCYNDERIEGENPWIGTAIRKDWLDDLGLETPETIEDWHTVLTAFKENYGACMALNARGINYAQDFISAYGVLGSMYRDSDNKVHYGPAEQGFKEYLATMQQWYAEGLIDQNFNSFSEWSDPNAKFASEEIGAGPIIGSFSGTILRGQGYTEDEDFYLETVKPAVLNKGDVSQYGMDIPAFSRSCSLTNKCDNPELALRYIDLFFDWDVCDLNFYGIEGESYTKENGVYEFTDLIRHDPNGISAADKLAEYILKGSDYFGYYNWAYAVPMAKSDNPDDPDLNALQEVWKVNTDLCLPTNMTMSPEETTEYYNYYTDIETMTTEYSVKVIMGQESLDGFDDFVNTLKNIGLDRCVEIQQNALDRYLAR